MKTLYHFTSEHHLPSIVADGVLRTTDPNLFATGPATFMDTKTGEVITVGGPILGQPVVWFFDTPTVPSGDHGLDGSTGKNALRVTVVVDDGRLWLDWVKVRRHDPGWVRLVVRTGGGERCARHWYVVPRPVTRAEWVEVRDMRTAKLVELP